MMAIRFGPNITHGTSRGSFARVTLWQFGQATAWSRFSVTSSSILGTAIVWCRMGSPCGISGNGCLQHAHRFGNRSRERVTFSGGTSARWCPSCPGCPPGLRPEPGFFARAARCSGESDDGGLLEFRELFSVSPRSRAFSASSSAIRASFRATSRSSSAIRSSRQSAATKR